MAKFFNEINEENQDFIARQKIFFVSTAMPDGRINLSPKGMDTFRVLDAHTVCFLNLTGSANETAAHLAGGGRMTLMFCSFDEQPLILRLYGQGRVIHPRDAEWATYVGHFPDWPGKRQLVLATIDLVQSSCGYAVPFFAYQGEREQLQRWSEKKGEQGIQDYWEKNNQTSIDGLPTYILP
ncbi:MAG: pyridoxamine 5'-phosphate oxidase family protein [Magnetococcales bacterium]|nr:pyridoxamine 5'-phosphate oxidase family protein [Magnetococcales bacterium]MBF0583939.1 pyridoxamine 5'-phosphate oxidase family protein [Magnetococcales bacterium]